MANLIANLKQQFLSLLDCKNLIVKDLSKINKHGLKSVIPNKMTKEFENELHELSPFLADLKWQATDDPFEVPNLYFDNLADAVELRELSPILANLKQQSADYQLFKVPELYFNKLADAVELRELSPVLADLKQQNAENQPFKVPKFYFDTLADKVVAKAQTTELKTKQVPQYFGLFERFKGVFTSVSPPKWAMAFASLAFVAAAGWYALTRETTATVAPSNHQTTSVDLPNAEQPIQNIEPQIVDNQVFAGLNAMEKADIHAYITDNLSDFDEALLIEHAPKLADVLVKKEENTEGVKTTHPDSGLTEEELEQYLKENAEEDSDGSNNKL